MSSSSEGVKDAGLLLPFVSLLVKEYGSSHFDRCWKDVWAEAGELSSKTLSGDKSQTGRPGLQIRSRK